MFSNIKVLIAEDDIDQLSAIGQVARSMGFTVLTCSEVAQGCQQVKEADIMFLDMVLANGLATPLLTMWKVENRGPVCVVNGENTDACSESAKHSAWNIMNKPVSESELRAALQRYGEYVIMLRDLRTTQLQLAEFMKKYSRQTKLIWALFVIILLILGIEEAPTLLGLF